MENFLKQDCQICLDNCHDSNSPIDEVNVANHIIICSGYYNEPTYKFIPVCNECLVYMRKCRSYQCIGWFTLDSLHHIDV